MEISDYGVEDAEKYFDDHWEEAVKITENDVIKKSLLNLVENETLVKDITPFEAVVIVIKAYFDSFEQKEIGVMIVY